jgi:hypothetical protein
MGSPIKPDVKKIADFILTYVSYPDRDKLEERIAKHIEFKTYFIVFDMRDNICACCLWNINGGTAHILDCVIANEHRNDGILRNMLTRGLAMWPGAKNIKFNRDLGTRWPEDKTFDIWKLLRRL